MIDSYTKVQTTYFVMIDSYTKVQTRYLCDDR